MYNSTNLPLEPRKVIKKSLGSIIVWLILVFMVIGFLRISAEDFSVGDPVVAQLFASIRAWTWMIYIVIVLLSIVYNYLYYKFYYYNFLEDSAEIKKGVIAQATGHVYYKRIQNIYVDQDILDRIMGLYDVHYETAGESSAFYSHVDGLNKTNADKLVQFILGKAKNAPDTIQNQTATEKTSAAQNTPPPPAHLTTIYDKNNLPLSSSYAFLMILKSASPPFFLLLWFSLLSLGSRNSLDGFSFLYIFCIGLLIITTIYTYLWVKYLSYDFDQIKGTLVTGVIARQTKIVYYNRIQNINIGQSFFERIFGLYNISIETAGERQAVRSNFNNYNLGGSTNNFAIPGLKKKEADKLKNFLLENSQISRANI